jgi:hypothetical protein
MNEKFRQVEKTKEHIPTYAEILHHIQRITRGKPFTERRKIEGGNGLRILEVVVKEDDGGTAEYSYQRKDSVDTEPVDVPAIHVTYFDSDGVPITGYSVMKLEKGIWKETL